MEGNVLSIDIIQSRKKSLTCMDIILPNPFFEKAIPKLNMELKKN